MTRPPQAESKTGGLNPLFALCLTPLFFVPACSTDSATVLTPLPAAAVTNQQTVIRQEAVTRQEAETNREAATNGEAITNRETIPDQETARRALQTTDVSFSKLVITSGPAEAFYQFLAPGGTVLLQDTSPLEGREVVRIHFAASPQIILDCQPIGAEISAGGDLGYTWGTFEIRKQLEDGKIKNIYGKYVSVWKKQADSTWRIVLHSSNSSPPPNTRR
jgi:ketosteroid isomerase-like protein